MADNKPGCDTFAVNPIGYIHTDFTEKFGIPRQSGLVPSLRGSIVLLPGYRSPEAIRGIEEFSHLWIIWRFSENTDAGWHPTVRPPRLGGNKRIGVFASRSPFRPNGLGLSCVKLEDVDYACPEAPVITVSGIDMLDGTPVIDIKPYIPVADCRPDAAEGYTAFTKLHTVKVEIPQNVSSLLTPEKLEALRGVLAEDPRPGYDNDPEKEYGLFFSGINIRFRVASGIVTVTGTE